MIGLIGEKSVEVTAAVSEETLRRKKIAEAKLREDLREKFQQIPASKQKHFINKAFVERQTVTATNTGVSPEMRAEVKGMRYPVRWACYQKLNDDGSLTLRANGRHAS